MKPALLAFALSLLVIMCNTSMADSFKLENKYISLSGKDGVIDSLCFDPAGKGHYGKNHIISFSVGVPIADPGVKAVIDSKKSMLILQGVKFKRDLTIEQKDANFAEELKPNQTLGQSFTVEKGFINAVSASVPTWFTTDSAATISLYRLDGSNKTKVASKRFENIRDGQSIELQFPDQPFGEYLIELSDVKGKVGWWSLGKDSGTGKAYVDDTAKPNVDRSFRCYGYEVGSGDLEIKLDKNKLSSVFHSNPDSQVKQLDYRLVTPWVKSGYDTTSDNIIFHHFLTSRGIYMPVHQFKRRPISDVNGQWVLMSGRFGTDLKFTDAPIHLEMAEDSMTMVIPGDKREIEVLSHTDKLPDYFPEFYSSDPKMDKVLNEFLLSHNFNFGVGTNPDWKEWHTLQLSWTANPECVWQRQQFVDHGMDPDGYLYCWGADPGWPFPYKDEDKDGKNDYDTRHFTTNPCYVLGAWREYCWNPDRDYLQKIMPRVRLAMQFMLKEEDGSSGLIVMKAPGHEGRNGSIGSNYWDILPFGYKSAFENAHFYPSLEAMAQLEEAASREKIDEIDILAQKDVPKDANNTGSSPAPDPRPLAPGYYRRLAVKARKAYNDTFWLSDKGRYMGCVDIDGKVHDYGFTFVNLTAMGYGLPDQEQVKRVYDWMENGITHSGKADTYSRWIIAPRASTIHNPKKDEPQTPVSSWWSMSWGGTDYDDQCQDGGAILYTSYYDIIARAKYLGVENAWKRFTEILDRYSKPDHLSGGSPLFFGEKTQGGPGGTAGSVGVEGEFPESGLVPVSFLYAFLGIDADIDGIKIRPNLPSSLKYGGVRNLRYKGLMYDIRVTNFEVEIKCISKGHKETLKEKLKAGEVYRFGGF